jgi:hypothetical protein
VHAFFIALEALLVLLSVSGEQSTVARLNMASSQMYASCCPCSPSNHLLA